jgi:hypothetical protein
MFLASLGIFKGSMKLALDFYSLKMELTIKGRINVFKIMNKMFFVMKPSSFSLLLSYLSSYTTLKMIHGST